MKPVVAAQYEDPTIARVLHFMETERCPTYQERQRELAIVRQLLHEWKKLFIAEDVTLYNKSGSRDRMVLPQKYHKWVYVELLENIRHLSAERVVGLAKEGFY